MVVRDEKGMYLGIRCDAEGCGVMSPPATDILAGHGLNNMGWECHGGTHRCPAHAQERDRREKPKRMIASTTTEQG